MVFEVPLKKVHQPKIEIPENLKEHFSKATFYGLHTGTQFDLKTSLTFFISLILYSNLSYLAENVT